MSPLFINKTFFIFFIPLSWTIRPCFILKGGGAKSHPSFPTLSYLIVFPINLMFLMDLCIRDEDLVSGSGALGSDL